MAELADARDLKSLDGDIVPVRTRSPAPEKNPHLSTTSVGSFQRNKSLAGFVKFASQVKYACGVWNALRRVRDLFHFTFCVNRKFHNDRRSLFQIRRIFHFTIRPFCCIISSINWNLNISKLWPFNRGYSALIKSSKSLENKGFIAMCSPYLFIRLHTSLLFPSLLIRANARARKSHNKI